MEDGWEEEPGKEIEEDHEPSARLAHLPLARIKALEAKLHAACSVDTFQKCQSCELSEPSDILNPETAAILRCGHIFCRNCVQQDRDTSRKGRYCPRLGCAEKFRSMYVLNGQGKLVRWSIGGDREKSFSRNMARRKINEEEKEKKCVIQ